MNKLSSSTILNLGSLATFIAFPFLYSATYSGNLLPVWAGLAFIAVGVIAPFIALKASKKQ